MLLRWYPRVRRDLPWRRTKDPYRIWLSEIMLQQTRVEAVSRYYARFLDRFPDLASLARTSLDRVLATWSGLGYYRRARMLHAAAIEMVNGHGGRFPRTFDDALSLPGIGRSTAGAILSIAYDLPFPVLDGNVQRVLCRYFALDGDPRRAPLESRLWEIAAEVVGRGAPGDVNQALMEIGATVCLPAGNARCDECPVNQTCRARALGRVAELPRSKKRAPLVPETWLVALVEIRGCYLVRRRDEKLLHGMWELPTRVAPRLRNSLLTARELVADELRRLGVPVRVGPQVMTHRQAISGRNVLHRVFAAGPRTAVSLNGSKVRSKVAEARAQVALLPPRTILRLSITTATRRILERFEHHEA